MQIKEFSEATGLSRDTIRFYEKRGLLSPGRGKGSNRYRQYTESDLGKVADILIGQTLGFTLTEIKHGLDPWRQGSMDQATKIRLLEEKVLEVQSRIADLRSTERYLKRKLAWIRAGETGPPPQLPPSARTLPQRRGGN